MIRRPGTSLLIVAQILALSIMCAAQSPRPFTRHVRDAVQNGEARYVGDLPASESMRLVLVLPLRNEVALDNFLQELYDPGSPSYRHFLTVDEFAARFGPTQPDYDAVIRFAKENGLEVVGTSRNRLNVDVTGSVASIEAAFHLKMGVYMHPTENRMFYAPDREPAANLSIRLWRIAGIDSYSLPRPLLVHNNQSGHQNPSSQPNATTGSGPSASFLGSDLRAAYYGDTALNGSGQSLGLVEFYGTDLSDLSTYYANVGQTNAVPITLLSTDGTSTSCVYPFCDDTEQTIDMTQALGMAPGLSSLVVYVGSTDAAIFNAMATASPLNAQLSSSWAWSPADPATDDPYFKEFAAQGQSLFEASGDSGAWKSSSTVYPADDVYLTAVGGTSLQTSGAGGVWSSESAWVDGGGGISPNQFAIPAWQTATANACTNCSTTLRNAPDVSANADFTYYVCADQSACTANHYGGTSFAAPLWAGFMALTNQQAAANGQPSVGFINPIVYTIGQSSNSALHDITSGSNGFSAATGFDLATGWGSPNGPALINALLGTAPAPGFSLSASPGAVTVAQGASGTSTITSAVTGGFNSAISLSASGQPAGVTVSFSPPSITGAGTATMTMTVDPSTVAGTYTIMVTGSSGSTSTTSVSLTVTSVGGGSGNFAISASPSLHAVIAGSSGTYTITTTLSGGFNSAITLSASGGGAGTTFSFSPNPIAAPGSGRSTMTFKTSPNAATGFYTITITASGGGQTHTAKVTLGILHF